MDDVKFLMALTLTYPTSFEVEIYLFSNAQNAHFSKISSTTRVIIVTKLSQVSSITVQDVV